MAFATVLAGTLALMGKIILGTVEKEEGHWTWGRHRPDSDR